jgi:rare lipoprotein A
MGERFNMFALTAAHKTLPLPSMILVENLENGKKLVVRVNDRGPYRGNRILDVSGAAARRLGFYHKGIAKVRIRTLVSESLKLKENQKNFCNRKRKKTRSCPVPNLSVQRYYVVVPAATLGKALSVKQALSEWGKTDLRKVYRGFHVMIGPYSTRLGAVQVQANLPKMYAARVLCFRRCPSMLLGVKRAKPHAKLHGVKTKSPQCKQVRRPLKRGKTGIRPGPAWVNA